MFRPEVKQTFISTQPVAQEVVDQWFDAWLPQSAWLSVLGQDTEPLYASDACAISVFSVNVISYPADRSWLLAWQSMVNHVCSVSFCYLAPFSPFALYPLVFVHLIQMRESFN